MVDGNGNGGLAPHPRDPERDTLGRFRHGNRGGPGRQAWHHAMAVRAAMQRALSEEDMAALIRRMHSAAMDGDVRAAEFAAARVIGPALAVDVIARLHRIEEALGLLEDDAEEAEAPERNGNGVAH